MYGRAVIRYKNIHAHDIFAIWSGPYVRFIEVPVYTHQSSTPRIVFRLEQRGNRWGTVQTIHANDRLIGRFVFYQQAAAVFVNILRQHARGIFVYTSLDDLGRVTVGKFYMS